MTSSESSSDEEIIGTDHFLSDHKLVHVDLYVIFCTIFWNDITKFWDENWDEKFILPIFFLK